ncbi:MAG: bifunctional DNA-formamidopyrimidine glycosylase/DNA-(apurinic or apyrimidinic site) lyase [bacterium]
MPELPEVETIRRVLIKCLQGKRIKQVLVREPRLRWLVEEYKLNQWVVGQQIRDVTRRAKYLLLHTQQDSTLILHLGMSGKLLLLTESVPLEKHDHIIFYFDDSMELRFRDPRRFGIVDAIPAGELDRYPRFIELGPEPLATITKPEMLFEKAQSSHRPIKNLLMDSRFIAGLGNIYANEALYYAGIHPSTPANLLKLSDWQKLLSEIRKVLISAIKQGGTTLNDFVDSDGDAGYFQFSLAVYGREGEPCPRCHTKIERTVLVGRSTYFCPTCQPKPIT